ncbi:hypothetical protein GCM10029964_092970 [Kibdelosporangium lantanae]
MKRIYDKYEMHDGSAPRTDTDDTDRFLYNPRAWKGSKYNQARHLSLTEIAKLMRADIKLARKVGNKTKNPSGDAVALRDPIADAPAGIKYSVRTEYYSGGGSIDITIKNIPQEWGWTEDTDEWGNKVLTATSALADLYEAVDEIHRAYNYDNSDIQTDYFDRNYYGHVSTEPNIRIPRRW